MRVLLANPPCKIEIDKKKEKFCIRSGSRWPMWGIKAKDEKLSYNPFPFYLAYAAALLEKEGFDIYVIDAIALNLTLEEFIQEVVSKSPDIILFETFAITIAHDLKLAQALKVRIPVKICLAGAHVTVFPEETLKNEYVDFALLKEYEINLVRLVKRLTDDADLREVPGLAYKDKGTVIVNPNGDVVDLDKLPFPARHLFPMNGCCDLNLYWDSFCQYRPAIQMHSSRGCPFGCNFCLWTQVMYGNRKYRVFPAKRVVDEMEHCIKEYNAKEIYFDDDSFTIDKQHVLSICREIKARGLNIKWSCMGDAIVTDEEMIDVMADAGCIGMKFGVESADLDILKAIDKPVSPEKVKKVARWCAQKEIRSHATFSFGLLGETRESMNKTFKFAKELDVDSVQFSITTPFPGTRYYKQLDEKELLLTKDWSQYSGSSTYVVKNPRLSSKEIREFKLKAYGRWYKNKFKNPKWTWRQIKYLNYLRKEKGWGIIIEYAKKAVKRLLER